MLDRFFVPAKNDACRCDFGALHGVSGMIRTLFPWINTMPRPHFAFTFCIPALLAVVTTCVVQRVQCEDKADPALELAAKAIAPLTEGDEITCRELFKQIASDDQDAREQALSRLVAKGPPILKLAAEFSNDPDLEIAHAARGLSTRILCSFDGYLPVNPDLLTALKKQVSISMSKLPATTGG